LINDSLTLKQKKKSVITTETKKKILRVVSKSSAAFVSGGAEVFCLWGWPRICGGGYRNITSSLFSYPPPPITKKLMLRGCPPPTGL